MGKRKLFNLPAPAMDDNQQWLRFRVGPCSSTDGAGPSSTQAAVHHPPVAPPPPPFPTAALPTTTSPTSSPTLERPPAAEVGPTRRLRARPSSDFRHVDDIQDLFRWGKHMLHVVKE
eukprot:6902556-Alexandrium_andersonii.AAC.1